MSCAPSQMQLSRRGRAFWRPTRVLDRWTRSKEKYTVVDNYLLCFRLNPLGLENTEENRRLYRQLLFTGKDELAQYVSSVILFDETLYQKTDSGVRFVDVLKAKGI